MINRMFGFLVVFFSGVLGYLYFSSLDITGSGALATSDGDIEVDEFLYRYQASIIFVSSIVLTCVGFFLRAKIQRNAAIKDVRVRVEREISKIIHLTYGYFQTFYNEIYKLKRSDAVWAGEANNIISEFVGQLGKLDLNALEAVDSALVAEYEWGYLQGFILRINGLKEKADKLKSSRITINEKIIATCEFLQKDFTEARQFAEDYTGQHEVYGSNTQIAKDCLRDLDEVRAIAQAIKFEYIMVL